MTSAQRRVAAAKFLTGAAVTWAGLRLIDWVVSVGSNFKTPGRIARFLSDRVRDYGWLHGLPMALAFARESRVEPGTRFFMRAPGVAHSIAIRAGTSDIQAFDQIFGRREVEFPLAQPPRVIIDAGANIGLASIALAIQYPAAKIVALELDAGNYELLVENVRHYPTVIPVHCGLWSHRTRLQVANPSAEPWAFRGKEAGEITVQQSSVEALGVADVMERFDLDQVDLLKMDIEGGELEVLGSGTDKWIGRIGALAAELHDRWVPGCTAALEAAIGARRHSLTVIGEYHLVQFSPAH